jgi:type IV secretory pathway TrbD component
MSVFEAAMLICFGISWPVSIMKSLRTRIVVGKSPLFMVIVCAGYLSGIIHKILYSPDWIVGLYGLNMALVAVDLALYLKFSRTNVKCEVPPSIDA